MSWRDWPTYSTSCRQDVQRLLRRGQSLTAYQANPRHGPGPTEGSWTWKLEQEAKRVHQVAHVIACANGTIALTTLLRILYPRGGEVVTTPFTFSATIGAILHAGLIPVFADVHWPTGTLLAESARRMATARTVDFLAVDFLGRQAMFVGQVVDACQAVGLPPQAAHGVWSFNGRKNVPAGEGGAIFTQDDDIAARCRLMLGHAENFVEWVGSNGHMNEVTACLAYHGMRAVQRRNAHRVAMATFLNTELAHAPVITPEVSHHVFYGYPLVVERDAQGVAERLSRVGVVCSQGYIQPPLHRYRAFQWFRRDALPTAESLSSDRLLVFPQVTPTATRSEMAVLGKRIRKAL